MDVRDGTDYPRSAFRPVPNVDAALLTIRRRDPAVLPDWLATGLTYLTGYTVGDEAFLATGTAVFNGAEIRINGTVHLKTVLPPEAVVPIGYVAVGDPVSVLSPDRRDEI